MMVKIVAMGFVFGKGTYLRDPWNGLDFVVVVLGLAQYLPGVGNFTALRTVRVLRPLRAINRVKGMRVLVATLLKSLPMLFDVVLLCGFVYFVFGIAGVETFAGQMRYACGQQSISPNNTTTYVASELADDPDASCGRPGIPNYIASEEGIRGSGRMCPSGLTCFLNGNPNYGVSGFDNILKAWLTIFQSITTEGWSDIMYVVQDASSWWTWPYFVALIVTGTFFTINLALAVICTQFTSSADQAGRTPKEEDEEEEVDDEVVELNKAFKRPLVLGEKAGGATWPERCARVVSSRWFGRFIMALIILNTIAMASYFYGMPDWLKYVCIAVLTQNNNSDNNIAIPTMDCSYSNALEKINWFLTVCFAVECALQWTAAGTRKYFTNRMNVFDFVIVVTSVLEIAVSFATQGSKSSALSALRALRIFRVFKLVRSWKQLQSILGTIVRSLNSVAYVSLLVMLFVFIFGLLGMQLLGYKCVSIAYTIAR
eukprot:jgi/Chlat1/5612/Chrsp369S09000